MSAPLTAADIDARFQPTRERATICLDSDIVLEVQRLSEQLEQARRDDETENRVPQAPAIAERIVELVEQARANEVEFVFRGIGRGPYRRLVDAHPPTEEQVEKAPEGRKPRWNDVTFAPALLAAACEEPTGTTEAWWAEKWNTWEDGRLAFIWAACVAAQEGYTEVPKAELAYELTQTSEQRRE